MPGVPTPERFCGPQDGFQNAPRSAQAGSKRLLKSNFFAFDNYLNQFSMRFGCHLGRFGRPKWGPIGDGETALGGLEVDLFSASYVCAVLGAVKLAQEAPKTPQRAAEDT